MNNKESSNGASPVPPSESGSLKSQSKPSSVNGSTIEKKTKDKPVNWSPENEEILVEWCDVAKVYKWLSAKSHAKYRKLSARFTLPAITLSTITGTASFAQSSLPPSMQSYAPAIIGSINIFIGILTTIQQYLKIGELNEAYRVSSIAWDKFARNIKIELAKDPSERTDAGQFTKMCRNEYDRLMETSPPIEDDIIKMFKTTFQGKPNTEAREIYDELRKPDICSTIISCNATRNPWYKQIDQETSMEDFGEGIEMQNNIDFSIKERLEEDESKLDELLKLRDFEASEKLKQQQIDQIRNNEAKMKEDVINKEIQMIKDHIQEFNTTNGRIPIQEEIDTNMKGRVSDEAISRFKIAEENV
jgi:hypothetical protein